MKFCTLLLSANTNSQKAVNDHDYVHEHDNDNGTRITGFVSVAVDVHVHVGIDVDGFFKSSRKGMKYTLENVKLLLPPAQPGNQYK